MAEFKHLIRIRNTDVRGEKPVYNALRRIKGVSYAIASAVLNLVNIPKQKRAGDLTDDEVSKIDGVLASPTNFPAWLFNRRADPETGEDKHLLTSDLRFTSGNDVKYLKKMKSYRGYRHAFGLPVRGQRTRSNFRKNKGKVTGVKRAKPTKSGK